MQAWRMASTPLSHFAPSTIPRSMHASSRDDRGIEAAPHRHRHKIPHVAAMIVTYVFATYELAINESSLRHIMIFH